MNKFKEIKTMLTNKEVVTRYLGAPIKQLLQVYGIKVHLEVKEQRVFVYLIKEYTTLVVVNIMIL